jgi:D-glutamate cyclase
VRDRIDRIEALIQRDVGRGMGPVFAAARGGLWAAADSLAEAPPRCLGLLTGFFVPAGDPPAAETDGPAGAALLARAFDRIGVPTRLLTDDACRAACEAALTAAGLTPTIDSARPEDALGPIIAAWRAAGVDRVIAIERSGLTASGRPRNMRGEDVGTHTAALDAVFTAGPWRTIAIGDGGNEVGMGSLPPGLIAASVPFGDHILCVTPAEHLVVAGVSHWGAYGLIAALAARRADWWDRLLSCLDPALDQTILEALVANGPAVDGVTLRREATIDGLDMAIHRRMLEQVRALVLAN